MPKDKKENPLIFNIPGKGKITICSNCNEWYLSPKGDYTQRKRTYLDNNWFYEKLKDNLFGICRFASIFKYECDFRLGNILIEKYNMEFIDCTGNCGMDTDIYYMEVFAQIATGCNELHWW